MSSQHHTMVHPKSCEAVASLVHTHPSPAPGGHALQPALRGCGPCGPRPGAPWGLCPAPRPQQPPGCGWQPGAGRRSRPCCAPAVSKCSANRWLRLCPMMPHRNMMIECLTVLWGGDHQATCLTAPPTLTNGCTSQPWPSVSSCLTRPTWPNRHARCSAVLPSLSVISAMAGSL